MGHVTYRVGMFLATSKNKCHTDSKLSIEECLVMRASRLYFSTYEGHCTQPLASDSRTTRCNSQLES